MHLAARTRRTSCFPVAAAALLAALAGCPDSSSSPAAGASVFLNVLPPGANGNSAGGNGFPGVASPSTKYPRHFEDQLALYGDLSYAQPNLTSTPCAPPANAAEHRASSASACNYFKSEGLTPDTVASTETLTAPSGGKVTIERDGWGVPFVSAASRSDAMYGFGYASGEDRLWLYDLLRNLGRGRLSAFLGPADGFYSYDANLATVAGYSEDELAAMVAGMPARLGALGRLIVTDIDQDVAGINAYIDSLSGANASRKPPEYATLKNGGFPPPHFTPSDIVASATLIQSIFAGGGGDEPTNELLLQHLDPGLTPGATSVASSACTLWRDLRHADDPDAARTIDAPFHQSPPSLDETCPHALRAGAAIWDPGTLATRSAFSTAPAAAASVAPADVHVLYPALDPRRGAKDGLRAAGLEVPDNLSNFIAVTASQARDGHPIAVMGPQTSYFVPQLLWEVALHSSGGTPQDFDGRGIVFGNLPYIEIGRALDYAWSATSGDSDLTDVRVSKMCNLPTTAGAPSRDDANGDGFPDADGYLFDAGDGQGPQCRRFYERSDQWDAEPTVASQGSGGPSQAQTATRKVLRTHYGPVIATATVGGAPVALSIQRSTFGAELDTAVPFALASAHVVHDAAGFQKLFNSCTGTFNWLYVDSKDLGYLHAGLYPLRDPGQDPDLPVWGDGRFEWASDRALPKDLFATGGGAVPYPNRVVAVQQGDALSGTLEWQGFMPFAQHPQAINPSKGWIASWNNSPAPGWWAADGHGSYGPTHRVDTLVKRLEAFQASGKRFDFGNMVEIMADAGFTDLRGQEVMPLLLESLRGGALDDTTTQVVALLQSWLDAGSASWISGQAGLGAWRRDRDADGKYDHRQAVVLMDAWYPHLIDALLPQVTALDGGGTNPTSCSGLALQCRDDAPRAQGSAYEYGYYEMMKRVLQMALGTPGHTDYRALKCAGTGVADDCRSAALAALAMALSDLGGWAARASWDGTTLVNAQTSMAGETVETYDAILHQGFSLLPVPSIPWVNRPTFQQVVEIQ
jgi:acyl-homoserine lactone acylase PvdQ